MSGISTYIPSISHIKGAYVSNKTSIVSLLIILAASFATMVTSAYCADHVNRSQCGKTDPDAIAAHQWATTSAILSAFITAGSVVGVAYLIWQQMKKTA